MCCKLGVSGHRLCREQRFRTAADDCTPGGLADLGARGGRATAGCDEHRLALTVLSLSLLRPIHRPPLGNLCTHPLQRASLPATCVCEAQSGNLWVGVLVHPENKQAASFFTGRWLNIFPGSPFYLIHKSESGFFTANSAEVCRTKTMVIILTFK